MLHIKGSTSRAFIVEGSRPAVYAFYSDLPRVIPFLPHIDFVGQDSVAADQFRVMYNTVELGTYHVQIVCDLKVSVAEGPALLRVESAAQTAFPAVEPFVGMTAARGVGEFGIESRFVEERNGTTRVDYALRLVSTLPKPVGLNLVPGRTIERLVERVARSRLEEIVDRFVVDSRQAFTVWLAEGGV